MSDEITLRAHRTTDLTEAAALWTLGHAMHRIETEHGWATFVIGYETSDDQFQEEVDLYQRGLLLVEAREFARRRNELAAKMRKAISRPTAATPATSEVVAHER